MPNLQWLVQALVTLKERYQDPDPVADKALFDAEWSRNGALSPTGHQFMYGREPHQIAMAARIAHDLEKARGGLGAIANEATSYLTAYTVLLAAVSFAAGDKIGSLLDSPYRWLVWPFAGILILLLRSHASPLLSWVNNYRGAGEKASRSTSQYAYINSVREDILKINRRRQRARRLLALVHTLVTTLILVGCVVVTL